MMKIEKVCVRIPADRKTELLEIAKGWREMNEHLIHAPGWDAQAIHRIARERFGGLELMFKHHGWNERGSDMMRYVQRRVKETYGSVKDFVRRYELSNGSKMSSKSQQRQEVCPECGHVFQGNGWDGIDAHWRSKHEMIMPYEEAWPLLKSGTYVRRQ